MYFYFNLLNEKPITKLLQKPMILNVATLITEAINLHEVSEIQWTNDKIVIELIGIRNE